MSIAGSIYAIGLRSIIFMYFGAILGILRQNSIEWRLKKLKIENSLSEQRREKLAVTTNDLMSPSFKNTGEKIQQQDCPSRRCRSERFIL